MARFPHPKEAVCGECRERLAQQWAPVDWHPHPWTQPAGLARPACRGLSRTSRARDLVDVAVLSNCERIGIKPMAVASSAAARTAVAHGLFLDVSQSIGRKPWRDGRVQTLTTASRIFSFEDDAVVLDEELYGSYGRHVDVDAAKGRGVTRVDLKRFLGNTLAVQPISTILHCMVAAIGRGIPGLWSMSQNEVDEEVE